MSVDTMITIEGGLSAVVPKKVMGEFDPITGGPVTASYANQNPIVLEQEIRKEKDYSINVYSTVDEVFYTQFQNNIIVPITYRAHLDKEHLGKAMDVIVDDGIYIVERYNLVNVSKKQANDFLDYYTHTRGISYDEVGTEQIQKHIELHRSSRAGICNFELRLVTYISHKSVVENQYTYVAGPGVVIIHGTPPEDLNHPYSPAYLEDTLLAPESDTGNVTIDISIIDNDTRPYYLMVGNTVKTIRPTSSKSASVLPVGATILTRRGANVIDESYIPLQDFEANGLYRSKVLCETNGNKSLVLEESKYKLDLEKSRLEVAKLKESNDKLKNDIAARELAFKHDNANRIMDIKHTAHKNRAELNTSKIKQAMDIAVTGYKHRIGIEKAKFDMRKAEYSAKSAELSYRAKQADASSKIAGMVKTVLF